MKITACKVNHVAESVGFLMDDRPVFSWKVQEAEGKTQKCARIVVALDPEFTNIVADTGEKAELDSLGTAVEVPISPRTVYYWKVCVTSDAEEHAESDVNRFETGKLDEAWLGRWITTDAGFEGNPIFEKHFYTAAPVKKARLYISGLGLYEAFIGGRRVGNEHLTPYCTDYLDHVQYQTYDVTELIRAAQEDAREEGISLSAELADGWYKGRFGFEGRPDGFYGDSVKLIAELRIETEDGEEIIASDESFEVYESNILFSNIYDGEHRDDTLTPAAAVPAKLLAEEEAAAIHLTERYSLPVLIHEEIQPVALLDTPAGEKVFDLGQNFAGIFRLSLCVPRGQEVHIQVGEVLQQGNFYRDNLRTAKAEYYYISDGRPQVIEPRFTFYGFRYVKVEGVEDLKISDLTGLAYYSDITEAGRMTTGDPKLNQLLSNVRWGEKGNFIDVPTDCPQRDERMGWTADTQVFTATACYLSDTYAFYRKYLWDMRSEQKRLDGGIPHVVPSFGMNQSCSVWGDAVTIIPWTMYLYYGDRTILRDSLESMKAWVRYIERVDGDDHHWRDVFHFGDWLALDHPDNRADQVKGGTEDGFIADVYYMHSADLTAKAARILGEKEDAETFEAIRDRVKAGILAEYFTPTGRLAIATQTGYTLALVYDLAEDRARMIKNLVQDLKWRQNHFVTGFVGTPFIMEALTSMGYAQIAYEILHNEEYPGWLYEINLGATTVWERWNSMNADGSVSSTGMNSFNHYAYGSVAQWMWQNMAGIRPVEANPGFRKAIIAPIPDLKTGFVEAEYDSPAGTYKVSWKIPDKHHFELHVEVPFGCTAELTLPNSKHPEPITLTAGCYDYCYETAHKIGGELSANSPVGVLMADEEAAPILLEFIPELKDIPDYVKEMTLRDVVQMGSDFNLKERLPEIDEKLKAL